MKHVKTGGANPSGEEEGNLEANESPFLLGEQIFLREVRTSDVNAAYRRWLNDADVNQYLETRFVPRSIENIAAYVRDLDGKSESVFFAICLKKNGVHVGNIKVGPINWMHRFADISLFIGDKSQWRRGLGSEAISLVTRFAFDELNLNRVQAGCYSSNLGSSRAFEKCGFRREGVLRKKRFMKGAYEDELLFGLLREEWQERR